MQIKKEVVDKLKQALSSVEIASRKKNITGEEAAALMGEAVKACRSTLAILRRLK